MARPPKGKPLTYRGLRLDDDVWAECQRLGKEHGTINEGMAVAHAALRTLLASPLVIRKQKSRLNKREKAAQELAASDVTAQLVDRQDIEYGHHETLPRGEHVANVRPWKRGPRQKGDKQR